MKKSKKTISELHLGKVTYEIYSSFNLQSKKNLFQIVKNLISQEIENEWENESISKSDNV